MLKTVLWLLLCLNCRLLCGFRWTNTFQNQRIKSVRISTAQFMGFAKPKPSFKPKPTFTPTREVIIGPQLLNASIASEFQNSSINDLVRALSKASSPSPGLIAFTGLYLKSDLSQVSLNTLRTILKHVNSLKLLNCKERHDDRVLAGRLFDAVFSGPDVHPRDFLAVLTGLAACNFTVMSSNNLTGLFHHFQNETKFMTFATMEQSVDLLTQLGISTADYSAPLSYSLSNQLFRRIAHAFPLYPAPSASEVIRLWSKLPFHYATDFNGAVKKQMFYLFNRNLINTHVFCRKEGPLQVFVKDESERMLLLSPLTCNVTFLNLLMDLPDPHFTASMQQFSRLKIRWSAFPDSVQQRLLSELMVRLPRLPDTLALLCCASLLDLQPSFDALPLPLQQQLWHHVETVFSDEYTRWLPRTTMNMAKMGMKLTDQKELTATLMANIRPVFSTYQSVTILLRTLLDLGLVYTQLSDALQEAVGDALINLRRRLKGHIREINKLLKDLKFPEGYLMS